MNFPNLPNEGWQHHQPINPTTKMSRSGMETQVFETSARGDRLGTEF